jgi:hypothetical protein
MKNSQFIRLCFALKLSEHSRLSFGVGDLIKAVTTNILRKKASQMTFNLSLESINHFHC